MHTDGSISGLQMKPGKGVDLREFGRASIKRVSEIAWYERHQAWVVKPLAPDFIADRPLSFGRFVSVTKITPDYAHSKDGILLFDNYDHAVGAEIVFFNALRMQFPGDLRDFST